MDTQAKFFRTIIVVLGATFSLYGATAPAAEKITHIHTDALGSPVAATDEAGNVIWREKYQPYGDRITNDSAASTNKRWYTGHQQDTETGLVYAGARYYDPVIGRFMAVDPVSFTEKNLHSFNRYNYGNNNPYKYIDPDGRAVVNVPFTNSYMYAGSGGVKFTTSGALLQRHPKLDQLSPEMRGPAERVLFEHEGRGNQPMIPSLGGERSIEEQRELVNPSKQGVSPTSWTLDSKHVISHGHPQSDAVDIVDRRYMWDRRSPAAREWWFDHGGIVEGEGLTWGGRWKPLDRGGLGKDLPHAELK